MFLYRQLAILLGYDRNIVDYIFGLNSNDYKSDIVGLFSTWLFYYIMIHSLYYGFANLLSFMIKIYYPLHPTNTVSKQVIKYHIKLSEYAFPLYTFIPVSADFARKKQMSKICDTINDCGGWFMSLWQLILFMFVMEFIIFFCHYWVLHVWKFGKKYLRHDLHHNITELNELTAWTGFALDPIDGVIQGSGIVITQLLVAIPAQFMLIITFLIGIYTMNNHQGGHPHYPWPFMGGDYHYIHHKYNWYNFGLWTMFWDYLFGTLRHPTPQDFVVNTDRKDK